MKIVKDLVQTGFIIKVANKQRKLSSILDIKNIRNKGVSDEVDGISLDMMMNIGAIYLVPIEMDIVAKTNTGELFDEHVLQNINELCSAPFEYDPYIVNLVKDVKEESLNICKKFSKKYSNIFSKEKGSIATNVSESEKSESDSDTNSIMFISDTSCESDEIIKKKLKTIKKYIYSTIFFIIFCFKGCFSFFNSI